MKKNTGHTIAAIKNRLRALITKTIGASAHPASALPEIETPPDETLGDLAFPCFALAKELKKSPHAIAQDIVTSIKKLPPEVAKICAAGPYVNFFLSPAVLAPNLLKTAYAPRKKTKEKLVVEYISPNTNKPLHLGHIRNGVLGDAVARLAVYTGSRVFRALLINDRGIHICKSMVAYQLQATSYKLPTPRSVGKKGDHFVGDYYVRYETLLREHPDIERRARECLQRWEAGDKKTRALWKKMNAWTISGMKKTTQRFGFEFDKTYYESDVYASGRDIILDGLKRGVFKEDETGAVYADLSPFNLPDKILLRQDGTALYITQDIFLAYKKWKDFAPTSCIYVVAAEQDLYFRQLFATLKLLDIPFADHLIHLSYGMVRLPEGKMKSREGTVVDADDLMDELAALARIEIVKREKNLTPTTVKKRSETIALAALKYYLLLVGPHSDMIFNPKESIALQGKTGPYLLYTYARLRSIARKARSKKLKAPHAYDYRSEKKLILALLHFEETIDSAARTFNPSLLAQYLWDLAKKTNDYYHTTPVIKSPEPARTARLLLIARIADTLKNGLELLGINTVEKM